ncbi:arylesterase [Elstera litoralis]|uniref:Arylesterase n=1 Tax=Elstera litoralis TaxID=552518 RepID=A0A0F3IWB5_9PROT|nr:SGNH/GDSL hydrolase family protein [Elstera litoralis]KJV10838.1 arylesterase [Elstera litoralis]
MKKTVLCYGDSLTWGTDAASGGRHDFEDRWPSVLQAALGPAVDVIAEGLGGRTTAYDDGLADCDRNGARLLPTLLQTHGPLDLVIIMLGTNDLKPIIHGTAIGARQGMKKLVSLVRFHDWGRAYKAPGILIVSPPPLCETNNPLFAPLFQGGVTEAQKLASLYADLADELGCAFFDAGTVARTTPVDGVHLDAENTRAVGRGLEPVVRRILEL